MGRAENFKNSVSAVLEKYKETTLTYRWEEGLAYEPDVEPAAFWIIELGDLINIVWLASTAVIDITLHAEDGQTTLNVLKYSDVTGIQIREGRDATDELGLGYRANYVVHVHATSNRGDLYWVARSRGDIKKLSNFSQVFLGVISED